MTNLTVQEVAVMALKDSGIPQPADMLEDLSPPALLWYLEETSTTVMMEFIKAATLTEGQDSEVDEMVSEVMKSLTVASGAIIEACKYMGLVPKDVSVP